ncbi:MAG: helix-turn-helix domain-containing protein [Pseudonocardiaceae bacterium]
MSTDHVAWTDVKAKARALDPRTDVEREVAAATARERREAYVRGHQLTEMRKAAGLTQAELAKNLGVSQARISKIEHGEVSGVELVRAYVAALGGTVDVIATLGDRTWKVA